MEKISKENLTNSAKRALSYNSMPYALSIYISILQDTLMMWVHVQKELNEDEKDVYYAIAGEICGDFTGLNQSSVNFLLDDIGSFDYDEGAILIYMSTTSR